MLPLRIGQDSLPEEFALGWVGTFGGAANAYTATPAIPVLALSVGLFIRGVVPGGFTNTLTATLDVSGLGAQPIQNMGLALVAGQIGAGCVHDFVWTGTAWELMNPVPVRGLSRQQASSTGTSTTTSTSYTTKLTLTATNLPAGTYGVTWKYQWRTGNGMNIRRQVDSVTTGQNDFPEGPDDTNFFAHQWYSEHTFTGAPATRTFRIQFASEFAATASAIRETYIYLERVA